MSQFIQGTQTLAQSSSTSKVNSALLAYHTDLFIVALIATFAIIRSPRFLARLRNTPEWGTGWILRHISYRSTLSSVSRSYEKTHPLATPELSAAVTDDSHTLYSHTNLVRRTTDRSRVLRIRYPQHIASCAKTFRPLLTPLRRRIAPGFSAGRGAVFVLYFGALVYAAFYKSSPFNDTEHSGWVVVAQLPFVVAYATKNNVVGWILAFGYEKLNYLHRFVGRLLVIGANVHGIRYFYKWSEAGTFEASIRKPHYAWAFVGLMCLDSLFLFSINWFRQHAYNVFFMSHIISVGLLFPALWFHESRMIPYILAAMALIGFDYLIRFLKTRVCTATIRPLPELAMTHVKVHYYNGGWRAGQHVRLRVLSPSQMGWWGWTEAHPFTIASVSEGQEGMILMCKKAGDWTSKLYEAAKESGYIENNVGTDVRVMVEGPYGGPGHAIFASYSAAVFVVAGSGIAFAVPVIQDLIQKDLKGQSRVKVIELTWIIPEPAALTPVLPLLTSLIQQSIYTPIKISIHYTRASPIPHPYFSESASVFPPGMTLTPGRPKVGKVLEAVISRAVSLGAGFKDAEKITGVLVAICGPVELADEVVKGVAEVRPSRRDQAGGIEIHEEVFGW